MKKIWTISMAACAILLGACTSPHLVTDASGNACHLNYTEVKAQFGEHFADRVGWIWSPVRIFCASIKSLKRSH